jgi:predicted N-formylglutamate amidohydrolase
MQTPAPLLGPDDPPPFETVEPGRRLPVVLACDHASRRIPRVLEDLGLPESALLRHIAWDIGAAEVTKILANRLQVPAVLSGYSRLVIDCNRHPDDPTSIVLESDGQVVPGNQDLTAAAREQRLRECFMPYHAELERLLQSFHQDGCIPALVTIHSFTPTMFGLSRPWHCGILWDRDGRLAGPMIERLRAEGLVVGDNEPYSGRHPAGYTLHAHADHRGWPHVCVEIRQDLIADSAGAQAWAERLHRVLTPLLEDHALYCVRR